MEDKFYRILVALPFLVATVAAFKSIVLNGLVEVLEGTVELKTLEWNNISVTILEKFYHIKALDDFWRPSTVAFAPSTLAFDPVSWWQMLSFITDLSLLYSLWLFEAVRVPSGSLITYPVLFGFGAQRLGIGVCAPIYYFVHYVTSPPESKALRKTDVSYTRTVFFTVAAFSSIPGFLMYLGPTLSMRHYWNWPWQMFPIFVSISQIAFAKILPAKHEGRGPRNAKSDITILRTTIGIFSAVSAVVWISLLWNAPYSLSTIFLPSNISTEYTLLPVTRRFLQCDHLWTYATSFLWLGYVFFDLKRAGFVKQSWASILALGVVVTACFGPGVAFAGGWLWREEILTERSNLKQLDRSE